MTKQRLEKELTKVRSRIQSLQTREKELEEEWQMAEDAEKLKFMEKHRISLERLMELNQISEAEIRFLLQQKKLEERNKKQEEEINGKTEQHPAAWEHGKGSYLP